MSINSHQPNVDNNSLLCPTDTLDKADSYREILSEISGKFENIKTSIKKIEAQQKEQAEMIQRQTRMIKMVMVILLVLLVQAFVLLNSPGYTTEGLI